ncbi:MAG: hypothetical protein LBH20_11135 [Treponema sp.]|jgi:hypothetical protein|nr:hypothetical protein [Treponema sp.]
MAVYVFPQNEINQRGSIPEELLRPRRDEAPRYPIDTVIGELGQGQASKEAYEIAKKTTAALLAGNTGVSVLSTVSKVFLEDCMAQLKGINPQSVRLGSGREEPDGSFSFLVRFIGREEGITGELFVRFEELRPQPAPPPPTGTTDVTADDSTSADLESEDLASADTETEDSQDEKIAAAPTAKPAVTPPPVPAERIWLFEDLILEEPRSRESENRENRHRFDFSPYERFY